MRYWDDLREPTSNFVQCPFELLDANISDKAKLLYLHLWKDAFTNQRWNNGIMYSDMSYEQMGRKLKCNRNYAAEYAKELMQHKYIEKKRGKSKNKWLFIKKRYWK